MSLLFPLFPLSPPLSPFLFSFMSQSSVSFSFTFQQEQKLGWATNIKDFGSFNFNIPASKTWRDFRWCLTHAGKRDALQEMFLGSSFSDKRRAKDILGRHDSVEEKASLTRSGFLDRRLRRKII
ncbi:hypothetical protein I3843_01G109800 [Carya illinoinensis]|nr:hypothetical protein I3843_01G109800 [Carya illinoinensis]